MHHSAASWYENPVVLFDIMQLPQDIWPEVRNKILTNPLKCLFTVIALPGTEQNILQLKNHSCAAKEKILLVQTTELIARI